jgi:hypothetical protein
VWGIAFIIVGAAAFWAARRQRKHASAYAQRAVATQAVVVRLETSMPGREMTQKTPNEKRAFPVLRFTDRDGYSREVRSRTSCHFDDVDKGQMLDILYDPDFPDDVRIGMQTDNGLFYLLIAAGLALVCMGIYGMAG